MGLAFIEGSVGWLSHSLALVAESGHMISDSVALGIALLASWISQFPSSPQATFGYRRVEILAALANGLGLLMVAVWIGWEATSRLGSPSDEILSIPMLVTAVIGFLINSVNALLLHDGSQQDLNLRGAFLHMVADAMSAVGVILAAIVVWQFHWNWADSITSLGVAILIATGAIPLIRQSLHILLEKTPIHLDVQQIHTHLLDYEGVEAVQQLRLWSIALGQDALLAALTVNLPSGTGRDRLLQHIQTSLQQEFGIQEIFLQLTAPTTVSLVNLSQPQTLEQLSEQVGRNRS
jgi:cobalt-zinc-cadmium efflux system protein